MFNRVIPMGEVCKQAHCTPRTVRYYEELGFIKSAARKGKEHRQFSGADISVIRGVQALTGIGYTIQEVKDLFKLVMLRDTRNKKLSGELRRIVAEIDDKATDTKEHLKRVLDDVRMVRYLSSVCEECREKDCGPCERMLMLRSLGLFEKRYIRKVLEAQDAK